MRTCPQCGYRDPAMQVQDKRKRTRAAYMRKYRKRKKNAGA